MTEEKCGLVRTTQGGHRWVCIRPPHDDVTRTQQGSYQLIVGECHHFVAAPNQRGSSGDLMLTSAVCQLLPTPRVTQAGYADDGRGGRSLDVEARGGGQDWGIYEAAIRRCEQAWGRAAPAPNSKGKPALNPEFVEWMMGLPAGHVTNPAIWGGMKPTAARNAQLKALGNGVVLQQAAAATRAFITDITQEIAS